MSVIYLMVNIASAVFAVYGMYCFIHDIILKKDR